MWSHPLDLAQANRQLSDGRFYERLDHDPINKNQQLMKSKINAMIGTNQLPPSAKHLMVPTPKTSPFYLLLRIHEPNNPGRPIASACSCPTENIASYLDHIVAPMLRTPIMHLRFLRKSILTTP